MSQIKSRNWTKKEDSDLLTVLQELKSKDDDATWNRIAQMIKQRNPSSRKTGKQCRERWANQLNPTIKRTQNWTDEENQILFRLHFEIGNKWSEICNNIPGRTDNCVKNHFYSTMRRGIRKINSYIENIKRKNGLAKSFKNQILNKILAISEGKNDNKYQFTNEAKQLALLIKEGLVKLALRISETDEENLEFEEKIYQQISEFSRNCRKKKTKKLNQLSEDEVLPKNLQNEEQIQSKDEEKYENDKQQLSQKAGDGKLRKKRAIKKQIKGKLKKLATNKLMISQQQKQIPQGQFLKIQKNIVIEQPSGVQKSLQFNPFPWVISAIPNYESFFNLNKNEEEINQDFFKNSQRGQINFLETVPEIKKNSTQKLKITESGSLSDFIKTQTDFSKQSQNYSEKHSTTYPEIMKSSDMQQSYCLNFSCTGREGQFGSNSLNISSAFGISGMSFSPGMSPFTFCTVQQSFNYFPNWPVQEEKLKSSILEQSSINDRQQVQKNQMPEIKSSFKAIKREKESDNSLGSRPDQL